MTSLVNYIGRITDDPNKPTRTNRKHKKYLRMPITDLPSGAHTGGNCDACNCPLGYWIDRKLCDVCLDIPLNAVTNRGAFEYGEIY